MLTDLVRGRIGFTGTVVSDYNGIGWAQTRQRVASSATKVGALEQQPVRCSGADRLLSELGHQG